MSSTSSPAIAKHQRIGIVVSRYNDNITQRLHDGAIKTLRQRGLIDDQVITIWVPGAWEIPIVAQELVRRPDVVGVITLGAVIRGETTHDVHINTSVSQALMQLSLASGKPVAFGVLTTNNLEQAIHRAGGNVGNKGEEAANAVLETLVALQQTCQA
jgi:6,7-dimethyl-8-ribityllumazine synthase